MVMNDNISEQKSLFQLARISLSAFLNNVQIELDRRIDDYENNRMWNACSFDHCFTHFFIIDIFFR